MAVSSHLIVIKALFLDPVFAAKSPVAKLAAVRRFTKAHLIVYQMGTHESQRSLD